MDLEDREAPNSERVVFTGCQSHGVGLFYCNFSSAMTAVNKYDMLDLARSFDKAIKADRTSLQHVSHKPLSDGRPQE